MAELEKITAALRACWSRWSVDPAESEPWSPENPGAGHCHVTALILRDHVGGELLEARVERADGSDGGWHYWNRLPDGREVDLTRDQFRSGQRVGQPEVVPPPADRTRGRVAGQYWLLRAAVQRWLAGEEPTGCIPVSVKAVCRDSSGRLLVCRNHRNEWELPGGRPEFGEYFTATVEREVGEETGLTVAADRVLGVESLATPGGRVAILAYACELASAPATHPRPVAAAAPAPSDEHTAVAFRHEAQLPADQFPHAYRTLATLA